MNRYFCTFLFSVAVTAAMNAMDMTYHLTTGWAVHLNYVAIKLTVIFLSVWIITQFIGIGKEEGIVAAFLGPLIFYLYYVFANPTLDRSAFKIDEQFWFFFLHAVFLLISYFSAYAFIKSKSRMPGTLGFVVTAAFTSIAFDALFIMIRWRINGVDEETAARMFTFGVLLAPVLSCLSGVGLQVLAEYFISGKYWNSLHAPVVSAFVMWLMTRDLMHAVFLFVFVNFAYFIIHNFKKGLASESYWKRKDGSYRGS